MPSNEFLRRNPDYRQAGDWRYDPRRNRAENPPRERKPPPGSNMDILRFKNQGYSTDEAEQMASDLRNSGMRTGFGGKGIEPDRNLTPRERLNLRLDKRESFDAPTGPTDDQRKWAKSFRESQTRPPLRAATADDTPGAASASARAGLLSKYGLKNQEADSRPPLRAAAGPINLSPAASAPKEPLNFSRSALIEGAKQSGDFSRIRGDFNKQSEAAQTGMRMNDRGSMAPLNKTTAGADGMTPYAREKFGPAVADKAAARDFAIGKSTTTTGMTGLDVWGTDNDGRPRQAPDFRREITSKYGSGTNATRTSDRVGGGTMTDPVTGKQVPMKPYLAQQSAVQDTKDGTSGFGENRTFNKAGDEFFNPQKLRESMGQRKGRV